MFIIVSHLSSYLFYGIKYNNNGPLLSCAYIYHNITHEIKYSKCWRITIIFNKYSMFHETDSSLKVLIKYLI